MTASPDFIAVYDDVLSREQCALLIEHFERSGHAQRGATGSGVDLRMKDSWDIQLDRQPGWEEVQNFLNGCVMAGLRTYLRSYPHVALAPLKMQMTPPGATEPVTLDASHVPQLDDQTLNDLITTVFRPGSINLQKYVAGVGGYPYWHCEQYPRPQDNCEALHRALLWTVYLNDNFEAGETEFYYQGRAVRPRAGSLLIAPTGFTHTHRGNRPEGGDKYIATSWILYQRAEQLFGAA